MFKKIAILLVGLFAVLSVTAIVFVVSKWTGTFSVNDAQIGTPHLEAGDTDLAATLSFAKSKKDEQQQSFRPGEPIVLDVLIKNNSSQPWSIDSRKTKIPSSFVIRNSVGKVVDSMVHVTYPLLPIVAKEIEPRRTYTFSVDLLKLYPPVSDPGLGLLSLLTPDKYSVRMVIESPVAKYGKQPGNVELPATIWPEKITTNTLVFTVRRLDEGEVKKEIRRIVRLPENERIRVIDTLGAMKGKDVVPKLVELAATDNSTNVRIAALLALGRIGDASVVPEVERILLTDESSTVQAYAAGLLGQYGLKRSVPALIEALNRRKAATPAPNEQVANVPYSAAIRALGDIGDTRGIPILTEISEKDPVDWVRKAAAQQIKRIEDRSE